MDTKFTYIRKRHDDTDEIFAIGNEEISEMKVSDTYDRYGQQVSPGDAGDSLVLLSDKAVETANRVKKEQDEDFVDNYYSKDQSLACFETDDEVIEAVTALEEGVDYEMFAETCKGFSFWNGNNWQSVVVEAEHHDPEWEIVEDENLIAELEEAIETREFVKEGFGQKHYESGKYTITDSMFATSFAKWEIIETEMLHIIRGEQ